ncbi:hypothetical protein ACTFIY_011229 [Dictyostelium cf. discoideum]
MSTLEPIPKLNIYLQRLILTQCWNHKFIEIERNNNGRLISWKIDLCFVSKSWLSFIQSVLYDSYIIIKPFEMILNYKSKYSIFQTPPSKLEISSNSYIQLLSHLTNEELRYNFFSNLKNLIFSYNSGNDIKLDSFKYLFFNSKQFKSIKINFLLFNEVNISRNTKTGILEGLYNSLIDLNDGDGNCLIENLELNSFCYENEFKNYFENLLKIIGSNLKRLVINNCPTKEMIETIVNQCNQYKLEELIIPSMFESLDDTIGTIELLKQSVLSKSLKSFSTSMLSQELHPYDFDHQVYQLFKEFLISMSGNLKHLSIALLNGLDKKGGDGGRFKVNNNNSNNNNGGNSTKLFELIKYILLDSSIESIEGDFIFSNYFLPLKEITIKKDLKILGVNSNDNNEELINQISTSEYNNNEQVKIYIGFPSISTLFLQFLKCESILIDIFQHNNLNINQLIDSIKRNCYFKFVEINFSVFSNLKNPISPLLLNQSIEILDSKNNNINHLILSLHSVKDVQSILKKFNDLKLQNINSILMWCESTFIKYENKKSINRDLKFYFENKFKLINN